VLWLIDIEGNIERNQNIMRETWRENARQHSVPWYQSPIVREHEARRDH
jgi:hypothetical protein